MTTEATRSQAQAFAVRLHAACQNTDRAQRYARQLHLSSIRGDHETRQEAYASYLGAMMCLESLLPTLHEDIALLVTLNADPVGRLAIDAVHDGRNGDVLSLVERCPMSFAAMGCVADEPAVDAQAECERAVMTAAGAAMGGDDE